MLAMEQRENTFQPSARKFAALVLITPFVGDDGIKMPRYSETAEFSSFAALFTALDLASGNLPRIDECVNASL
jgi:hypothetical protein